MNKNNTQKRRSEKEKKEKNILFGVLSPKEDSRASVFSIFEPFSSKKEGFSFVFFFFFLFFVPFLFLFCFLFPFFYFYLFVLFFVFVFLLALRGWLISFFFIFSPSPKFL